MTADFAELFHDTERDVRSAYLWQNGMLMVFNFAGDQIPELQGRVSAEAVSAIKARSSHLTEWVGFGEDGPAVWPR